ncbi:MAG: response regulator [Lachnospiraceae bacterium]|nr:response regulator [Lachnospiraceae bacterium]
MSKKVLICEDARLTRTTLRKILTEGGHEVVGEAVNGAEAVEKYKELQPEVVFMDIVMPEMDGLEALRLILEYDPNAQVIMCSSLAQQKKVANAETIGAKDFIVKPFTPQRVLDSIAKKDEK